MITDEAPCADVSAHVQVSRLMDGYLATQLLYVAAKLGLADALAGAPQSADALARAVGAEPDALCRVLRGLAAEGVLEEHPDGRFSLTALGTCLRSDVPNSLRGAILARGDLYYGAAAGLQGRPARRRALRARASRRLLRVLGPTPRPRRRVPGVHGGPSTA